MTTKEKNLYRDTWVRYLGYTNEIGESFRYVFPKFVIPSYIISFGYVFADSRDKSIRTYKKFYSKTQDGEKRNLLISRIVIEGKSTCFRNRLSYLAKFCFGNHSGKSDSLNCESK